MLLIYYCCPYTLLTEEIFFLSCSKYLYKQKKVQYMRNILCAAAIVKRNGNMQPPHLHRKRKRGKEKEKERANDSFVPLATSPVFVRRYRGDIS